MSFKLGNVLFSSKTAIFASPYKPPTKSDRLLTKLNSTIRLLCTQYKSVVYSLRSAGEGSARNGIDSRERWFVVHRYCPITAPKNTAANSNPKTTPKAMMSPFLIAEAACVDRRRLQQRSVPTLAPNQKCPARALSRTCGQQYGEKMANNHLARG